MKKKKKHMKIKWRAILKIILFLFCVALILFFLLNIKTRQIIIKGNTSIKDHEIITKAGLKNYPYLFRISNKTIKENILRIDEIQNVTIHKSLFGVITLEIEEALPIFFNRNKNKLVLSNGKEIDSVTMDGVPILINYVPENYYQKLIEKLKDIDQNVIYLISEIEYRPWKNEDVMIDESRFFLRMNDGNSVYVNTIHLEKLNNYIEIYASLEGKLGTLYLDSSSDKISFSLYP